MRGRIREGAIREFGPKQDMAILMSGEGAA